MTGILPILEMTKHHGLGNDFLVLLQDERDGRADSSSDPDEAVSAAVARALCDRHRGIGADGVITSRVVPAADGAPSLSFRLRNADGTEAEMSGNGMRCLAQAALDRGLVSLGATFEVSTVVGARRVTILRSSDPVAWVSVAMGRATIDSDSASGDSDSASGDSDSAYGKFGTATCNVDSGQLRVNMGNPHLVLLGPDPELVDVAAIGAKLDAAERGGLNVEFVALGPGPDELTMRVWERGVGETLACGTGACAAAVAAYHWRRVGSVVTVNQRGGPAEVTVGLDGQVALSGPSRRIGRVTVDPRDLP